MEIYYKKHIKTEADLPKDGEYIVHHKNSNNINDIDICREGGSEDAKEFETRFWTNSYDWYLKNIESEELQTPIEDGLYATGRFTQDECSVLANGLLRYIDEYLK